MIHAFLVTIGILAAITAFPHIARFTGFILTSVTFWCWAIWLGAIGLSLLLIGPGALPLVGVMYLIWLGANRSLERHRARLQTPHMFAAYAQAVQKHSVPKQANVIACRDLKAEPLRVYPAPTLEPPPIKVDPDVTTKFRRS